MVGRDEYGYVLKIVAHFPYHPWSLITRVIAKSLNDYGAETADRISSVGVYTPRFGLGSIENPKMVGKGEVDVGMTNPPLTAKLAMEGRGPFCEGVGNLMAIVRFPEPDFIFWLVAEELGIHTMEELVEREVPLILVSGRMGPTGPDTLTWTVEEVLKRYGFSYKDIERWGGKVFFPGQSIRGIPLVRRGEANAIFQEGVHDIIWEQLAESRPLCSLSLDQSVVDSMKQAYGFKEHMIPKGRLKGIERDQLTLDFGGWLLFCREDFPDELSYLLAKVCVEQSDSIVAPYKDLPKHLQRLTIPMTPHAMCSECVIPLHPGAENFYREIGAL